MRNFWNSCGRVFQRVAGLVIAGLVMTAGVVANAGNLEKTKELVAVLQSQAPLFEKARACQQLGEIGTKEAVPVLAALLGDEHLSAYARSGLAGIPDPSAAAALRSALGTLEGAQLAGVINSLGVLRDAQAFGALRWFARNPASGVSKEALLALGRIGDRKSIRFLRRALAVGPEALRADAAAGCLLAAEQQLAGGHAKMAATLYDAVRTAKVPAIYRGAATRGAILARQSGGADFLMQQLRGRDPIFRAAALMTIREIPGPDLADALNAELAKAGPDLQVQLLNALRDCHNAQSIELLAAKATGDDAKIRSTALKVLAGIAGPAQAGILLQVMVQDRNADEAAIAEGSLERLEGSAVDNMVLQDLKFAKDAHARVQLIVLLEHRGATNAAEELLSLAAEPDNTVSQAAFEALGSLAGAKNVSALIALTKTCKDGEAKDAAEKAVCRVVERTGSADAAGAEVLTELEHSVESGEKIAWVRILTSMACTNALPALAAATKDSNEAVAAYTIEALGNWPDPAPIDTLLAIVDSGPSPKLRQRALASVIQLAMFAADERQRSDEAVVGWIERGSPAAQSLAEQRQLISILGRLKRPESFRLLSLWLDQPELQKEAGLALVQIAPALLDSADSAPVKKALEKIAATASNADVRTQAAKLAQTIRKN
jgi:HEAT repeat protein